MELCDWISWAGKLAGVLSAQDLRTATIICRKNGSAEAENAEPIVGPIKVNQIMTVPPVTVSPDDEVKDAVKLMNLYKIHCLPVLDDLERLAGIVTDTDFLQLLEILLEEEVAVLA